MTVEFSPYFTDGKVDFNVPYKNLWYQVKAAFFPFRNAEDKEKLLKMDITEILTPIVHFEFTVLDIDKSIYRSYFLMSGDAIYIREKLGSCSINMIAKAIVEEIGYEKRIDAYILSQQEKSQLSLF